MEKILLVDDEANILYAYHRQFRKQFQVHTALGGEEGLKTLRANGPFAVVVSDFRMPGMDGNQFLARVRQAAPDTVRMMLTGNADLEMAIKWDWPQVERGIEKCMKFHQLVRLDEIPYTQPTGQEGCLAVVLSPFTGNSRGGAGQKLRPLFYDQGIRQGHRARAGNCP